MKFVQLKSGRDVQYPTGVEELLKCGRNSRALEFFPNLQKSSTNGNVKDYFIFEYISEICST